MEVFVSSDNSHNNEIQLLPFWILIIVLFYDKIIMKHKSDVETERCGEFVKVSVLYCAEVINGVNIVHEKEFVIGIWFCHCEWSDIL